MVTVYFKPFKLTIFALSKVKISKFCYLIPFQGSYFLTAKVISFKWALVINHILTKYLKHITSYFEK